MKIPAQTLLALTLAFSLLTGCDSGNAASADPSQEAPKITRAPRMLNTGPAEPAPMASKPTPQEGPILHFESAHKDFGKVPDTEVLVYDFRFKNTGTETLLIEDIKPSCGCTTTTLKKLAYLPGEGGAIDIKWEPKGHGTQSKTITVRSNSKRAPIQQLRISAVIQPFLTVTPARAMFDLVQRGSENEVILSVSCADPELEIVTVSGSTPDLIVTLLEPAKNGHAKIRVSIQETTPQKGVRRFFPKVQIVARARIGGTGPVVEHMHQVPVLAVLYDNLAPDPAFFAIGRILPGRSMSKEVIVTRPDGKPFEITGSELKNFQPTEGSDIRIEPLPANGPAGYKVTLSCTPGAHEGSIRGRVVLQTNLPEEPELVLEVLGVAGNAVPK